MENSNAIKDPVCGMTVTTKSFHHLEKDGSSYYFCGATCKARFSAPKQPLFTRLLRHFFSPDREALQSVGPK
jgi:YHS domain-containing protein